MRDRFSDLCNQVVHACLEQSASSAPASRLASGTFWSLLGGVVSQFLAFFASIWVARTLGSEQFGEFAMIRSTAMMFAILAAFGVGLTATKHVAEYCRKAPERTGRIVVLATSVAAFSGGAMTVLLCILASPLAHHALQASHLTNLLRIGALLVVLNTVIFVQTGVLAGFEAFKNMTKVAVIAGALSLLALAVATSIAGLQGAIWGSVAGLAAHCLLNHLVVSHEAAKLGVPLSFDSCLGEWRTLGAFSLPVGLSNIVKAPATWACHTLLVSQYGGYPQMGIFNAANQWRMAILFVPERICQITLPILSSLSAEGQRRRFRKTLRLSISLSAGASLLLALPIILLSPWIMGAYGSDFIAGVGTLCLLAISAVFVSVGIIGERTLASLGRVWLRFTAQLIGSAALLGCAYAFVANGGGAADLALAILISSGLYTLVVIGFLLRSMRFASGFSTGETHDGPCVS